ncbi:acyl-CoA dehydrogenase family protein [Mycobacterium vicinigordonae]|uniref:Acyl-CoA dehydrogenase family protein n=1 Tax=Mycobacterium vicinigordonae TaxID=1719132 RepID=A0A7D6HY29_9MYCO|nr:acyl-CoA dehydrogenase family protein [Mycobacterium vicinigordonae]QLL09793.1 acyl-CoA dehydrogenase family protein [Mycobacterium vicinigordonae]
MTTQAAAELEAFDDSVTRVIEKLWGDSTASERADIGELWAAAARLGWFDLGGEGSLNLAIAAARRLGRAACPLPILDGYAAAELFDEAGITDGDVRLVVTADPTQPVDAGGAASHVLVIPKQGGLARVRAIAEQVPLPGLAVPTWNRVRLGQTVAECDVDRNAADRALVLVRLGKAASALAAAEFAHEMAIEHAKTRKQFGKVIGSFGAVQQRTAQCQIEIRSANLLLAEAVSALQNGRDSALLAAEIAVTHIAAIAPKVQLGAHHTLAAIGYFNEHPAPWLFRRVHSDVILLSTLELARGSVGDVLVETESCLPAADLGDKGECFRAEFLRFIADRGAAGTAPTPMHVDTAAVNALAAEGWLGFGWPAEYGGRNASLAEQVVLNEETTYNRVGAIKALGSVMLLGSSILRHGTEEQKQKFLPIIRAGEMNFCLGYSEPEAGSDLASLRTRADRDGDEWVINGQKMWTTGAHISDWVWLAARSDPQAQPRHAGITVFLFRMDTPGVTIQQHTALSGEVSCTVFYDNVRVPDTARVGEVNGGWSVIVDALAGERITMGNVAASLHRQLDDLLEFVRPHPHRLVGIRGSAKRAKITDLAVRVQATRALVNAAVQASSTDIGAMFDAAMAGVMGGDLAEDFGEATLSIIGPGAALSGDGDNDIPGGGAFEYGLRQSIMYVVGGGTNDIQRGLIARGMGLPR